MMTSPDFAVLLLLAVGAVLLVVANVALLRSARPDRENDRIAGCCGMALPSEITGQREDAR
jgi:hypothetical protein